MYNAPMNFDYETGKKTTIHIANFSPKSKQRHFIYSLYFVNPFANYFRRKTEERRARQKKEQNDEEEESRLDRRLDSTSIVSPRVYTVSRRQSDPEPDLNQSNHAGHDEWTGSPGRSMTSSPVRTRSPDVRKERRETVESASVSLERFERHRQAVANLCK